MNIKKIDLFWSGKYLSAGFALIDLNRYPSFQLGKKGRWPTTFIGFGFYLRIGRWHTLPGVV